MKAPPPHKTPRPTASVLFAAPRADQIALSKIVLRSPWPLCPGTRWKLNRCSSVRAALLRLQKKSLAIVMCDCDLGEDAWIKLLRCVEDSPAAPYLIVTSRLADDHLWAEALNLGAHDVLAKPFDAAEVVRTLSFAWLQWANRNGLSLTPPARAGGLRKAAAAGGLAARTQ